MPPEQMTLPTVKAPRQRLNQVQSSQLYNYLKALSENDRALDSAVIANHATMALGFTVSATHVRNLRRKMGLGPRPRKATDATSADALEWEVKYLSLLARYSALENALQQAHQALNSIQELSFRALNVLDK